MSHTLNMLQLNGVEYISKTIINNTDTRIGVEAAGVLTQITSPAHSLGNFPTQQQATALADRLTGECI
jgi:hypothetical protein